MPTPEKRRSGPIPPSWFLPVYRSEHDADYLMGLLLNLVLFGGAGVVGAIILDARLAMGILVHTAAFERNKLLLTTTFSRLMGVSVLVLSVLFYLRIRIGIDIRRDDIPVLTHKALLLTTSLCKWIGRSFFGLAIGLIAIFATHIIVIQITSHYEQQNSLGFILLPQLFAIIAVAIGPIAIISYALVLEKAIFYPKELLENLARLHKYVEKKDGEIK